MRIVALGLFAAALLPAVARATPITYTVNIVSGNNSAVGTITTDGTIGTLTQSNFTAESLILTVNSVSTSVVNQTPIFGGTSEVSATASGLFFNFSGPNGLFAFANPGAGELCFASGALDCSIGQDVELQSFGGNVGVTETGSFEFASVPAATPEPSSLILLGTGALGIASTCLRRFRRA